MTCFYFKGSWFFISSWMKSIVVKTNLARNLARLDKMHSWLANVMFIFKAKKLDGWVPLELKQ